MNDSLKSNHVSSSISTTLISNMTADPPLSVPVQQCELLFSNSNVSKLAALSNSKSRNSLNNLHENHFNYVGKNECSIMVSKYDSIKIENYIPTNNDFISNNGSLKSVFAPIPSKFIEKHRGKICLDVMADDDFNFWFPSASGSTVELDTDFQLLLDDLIEIPKDSYYINSSNHIPDSKQSQATSFQPSALSNDSGRPFPLGWIASVGANMSMSMPMESSNHNGMMTSSTNEYVSNNVGGGVGDVMGDSVAGRKRLRLSREDLSQQRGIRIPYTYDECQHQMSSFNNFNVNISSPTTMNVAF